MAEAGKKTNRTLTTLVAIVATILMGWVLIQGASILQPLVIAILLCNVLQPVVRLLARFRIPSWVTVILLLLLLVWSATQGSTLLISEFKQFVGDKGGWAQVELQLVNMALEAGFPQELVDWIRRIDFTGEMGGAVFFTLTDFARGLLLVVLYMLFIFAEQSVFRRKILAVAERRADDAQKVLDSISQGIQRYLGVKTVTSLATGMLCYTVLLYLKVPYALLFGFMTFLLNYIPTFGSFAAAVLPILTALGREGGSVADAIIVAVTYLSVNVLLGSVLEPRLLGRELNLSPLVILVSVVVWAALWGIPGTFLAVPLTATAQIILANIESTRPIAVLLSNGPIPERLPAPPPDENAADPLA